MVIANYTGVLFMDIELSSHERPSKPCPCGSGKMSIWMHDCQGIPLDRVCDDCEEKKRSKYRPETFSGYTQADLDEYSGERIEPLD